MMVLITYDVETMTAAGRKRLRLIARECKNYGIRVQNSVFECVLNQSTFLMLKSRIATILDSESDSIRFYFMGKNWERHIEIMGKERGYNVTKTLIV